MVRLGKRHLEIATRWIPSAAAYGAIFALTGLYWTDWKVITQHIPYYNGKYETK